jgi:hypothetical protein
VSGVGMSLNVTACLSGIYLCMFLYVLFSYLLGSFVSSLLFAVSDSSR